MVNALFSLFKCCCESSFEESYPLNDISVKTELLVGDQILPYLEQISQLYINIYEEFPYLFQGDVEQQKVAIKEHYISKKTGIVCLLLIENQVVGAGLGCALIESSDKFKEPFIKQKYAIDNLFFWGELILEPVYRGKKLGKKLYQKMGEAIKQSGYSSVCFCTVERSDDHPSKPDTYKSLEPLWEKLGFKKDEKLTFTGRWQEIGKEEATDQPMVFWVGKI